MEQIDVTGIDKAEILAALYNGARPPRGMGMLQARPGPLTVEEAREILGKGDDLTRTVGPFTRSTYFDYLFGKVLKVDLAENPMRVDLYDRDNGKGAAERALASLRA